jgi:3'-5' exoribonuclease
MPNPVDIPRLALNARVQDTFLVWDVKARTLESGDPFTILILGNSTGRIATEPFWPERQQEVAGLRKGHAVQVIAEVGTYREKKQLKIVSVRHLPAGTVNVKALLPSVGSVDRDWDVLDAWRREMMRPSLRGAVDLFFEDDLFRAQYGECPAAISGHHAAVGGLLKHTAEVAAIARTLARVSGADPDTVLAGAFLHDIGKLESYRWDGVFDMTERGRLLGHVAIGVLMFDRRFAEAPQPPCSGQERAVLMHLILSHHGRLEWGAPVQPMTLEAEVLHWADNASAKTASVAEAIRDEGNFPDGPISTPQRFLDWRRLYRPERPEPPPTS